MKTTVDIEDDLFRDLKEVAHRSEETMRHVLNSALRRGLHAGQRPTRPSRYRCPSYAMGTPVPGAAHLDKALAMASDMEDTEAARKIELRK